MSQQTHADALTLALTKLYEPPHKYFPNRSIPVVLAFMDKHADELPIVDRGEVEAELLRRGVPQSKFGTLSDPDLTRLLVDRFRKSLPKADSFKFRRDKQVAHTEDFDTATAVRATWEEADELIKEAQRIAEVIGAGYIQFYFHSGEGSYMLTHDAEEASRELRNLLELTFDDDDESEDD